MSRDITGAPGREPANRSLQPFAVGLSFVILGLVGSLVLAAQDGFTAGTAGAALLGLASGIATCLVAIRMTRGRLVVTTGIGFSGVLLIAGLASFARHTPVPFQVAGLMWGTGFFASVTVIVFLEYKRGAHVRGPNTDV